MLSFFKRKKVDPKALLAQSLGDADLPVFPAGVMETLRLLRSPSATSAVIGKSIETNPGLVINVLKMVNSAAFGLRTRVSSISHGVSLLGRQRVEGIVVAQAVHKQLPKPQIAAFESSRFWLAAARRAALARSVAEVLHPQSQSEAFIAGMLQDMAVPLLASAQPEKYGPVLEHWNADERCDLAALEREVFGWDHPDIGASVASAWQLPDYLITAIGLHHDEPADTNTDDQVDPAVHLVSYIHESVDRPELEPFVEACRVYGLQPDDMVGRVDAAFEAANEVARLFV